MSRRDTDRTGRAAETAAAWLLRLKGFRILERRFATPVGEIDLVACRGDLLLFVEVKRRGELAAASEALLPGQQQRVARAAEIYLQRRPAARSMRCRFDVIAIAPWRWPVHVTDAWRL
ncbi:MAG TPA: YraN family protein [Geminicoccaceae bacterium]|nr:YraN family protein [Geminicoccus sp.]HMU48855.1 YraN family protein [Geminicoccaceae bacterium]